MLLLTVLNRFLAYLRGIETPEDGAPYAEGETFLAYLRGIETALKISVNLA